MVVKTMDSDSPDEPSTVTAEIVRAVAARKGVEATELQPRLYDVIDADALENIVDHADASVRVSFTYAEHEIEVTGDGTIVVDDEQLT
jgi:hypothetical protein